MISISSSGETDRHFSPGYGCRVLIAALVTASLIVAVIVSRQLRSRQLVWDVGSSFVFVIGWAALVPVVLAKFGNQTLHTWSYWGELVEVPAPVNPQVQSVIQYLILGFAVFLLWRTISDSTGRRVSIFGVAIMTSSMIAMVVDTSAWDSIIKGQPMVLLVVLAAASFGMPSREGAITGGALFAVSVCAAGSILGVITPDDVFLPCPDKCSIAGELYMGATPHSNTLGLITAIGIPLVWLAFNGRTRLVMLAYLVVNLLLTGSRTSMLAAAVTLAVLALTTPSVRGKTVDGKRRFLLTCTVAIVTVVAVVLPFTRQPDTFATGRGYLWRIALDRFEQDPFLGAGLTAWDRFYAAGEFGAAAAYSTHNQWLEVLLLSGVVGAAAFGLGYASLIFGGDDSRRFVILPVLLTIAMLSVTERPLSIGLINTMTWALVVLVAISTDARRDPGLAHQSSPSSRSMSIHHQ